ncbi:hypothetical protein LR48_Vigan11g126000 [Vigna angularis]|uniref:Uncharacterized protein n=1 Tax=Phaseolus angularis TaxID=3914 RepID=A0A0L9VT14_PHAAN|nr:hypothetical protein LR48_Vigan11g126000 [Vigna angularis]
MHYCRAMTSCALVVVEQLAYPKLPHKRVKPQQLHFLHKGSQVGAENKRPRGEQVPNADVRDSGVDSGGEDAVFEAATEESGFPSDNGNDTASGGRRCSC